MHRLIREYFRFNQSTDFDPNFQDYYLSAFLELYADGGTAGHDATYIAHKFAIEFPNLEQLFKILLNLSSNLIYEREAGVLAFGYINDQFTVHEHTNFSKKLFGPLNTYKQYLRTTLGEVRYNSLYARLLGQHYDSECKLNNGYGECKCVDMCKTAFNVWNSYGYGHKSNELLVKCCFECFFIYIFSFCILCGVLCYCCICLKACYNRNVCLWCLGWFFGVCASLGFVRALDYVCTDSFFYQLGVVSVEFICHYMTI